MSPGSGLRLLLVANPEPVHVGAHLLNAARALGVTTHLCDTRAAFGGGAFRRRWNWWVRGRRPSTIRTFAAEVLRTAREQKTTCVLATGIAPLDAETLKRLGEGGIRRLNFLTDDPWNTTHRAPWFLDALREYDVVFTPRRANIADLEALGGPTVSYLPFAYAPDTHYPESPATAADRERFGADLVFAGGADADRVRAVGPFIEAGYDVALYGGYWDRFAATRRHARGFLGADELRKAIAGAKVALCLVRRANRDGHSMRTFEVAAMGGCMLVEETDEHRDLFGADGEAVVFFSSPAAGVDRARQLLGDEPRRTALSTRVRALMTGDRHTYAARLARMVSAGCEAVA